MYGIVSAQLILTAFVAGIIYAVPPVRSFVTTSLAFQLTFAILPLVGESPLDILGLPFSEKHQGIEGCILGRGRLLLQANLSMLCAV